MKPWVWVVLLLALIVIVAIVYFQMKRLVRNLSKTLFGTNSIKEGIENQTLEYSETPKSLSAATSLYLPKISEDFPSFNLAEFTAKAENMLYSALQAVAAKDLQKLVDASTDLYKQVENQIGQLNARDETACYDNIRIHKTAVSRYTKQQGLCIITLQSAVEYLYFVTQGEKIVQGSDTYKKQTRYNIDLVYVQDAEQAEIGQSSSLGIKCPHCGAPVKTLGHKHCTYCGSGIQEIHTNVWKINKFKET